MCVMVGGGGGLAITPRPLFTLEPVGAKSRSLPPARPNPEVGEDHLPPRGSDHPNPHARHFHYYQCNFCNNEQQSREGGGGGVSDSLLVNRTHAHGEANTFE